MKHIVPTILLIGSFLCLIIGIVAVVLAFLLSKQTLLFYPAVMLTVAATIASVTTLVPSITLRKSRICGVSAVISALGLIAAIIAFIVLATL